MTKIDDHLKEMEHVKTLMASAHGKRLYDLQTYYKRLKKEYNIAMKYMKGNNNE